MPRTYPLETIHLDTVWPVFVLAASSLGLLSTSADLPLGRFWIAGGAATAIIATQMDALTSSQLGGRSWLPVVAGSFVFIFGANWAGALLPLELIHVPQAEVRAPTADVNVTASLALATSHAYFYAGFQTRSIGCCELCKLHNRGSEVCFTNISAHPSSPNPFHSSCPSCGAISSDELTIAVLASLVSFIVPVAVMCLGIFTSAKVKSFRVTPETQR